MIKKRFREARGFVDKGWVQSHHGFSFETYYDPEHLSFRNLRVMNEIQLQEGKGFDHQFHKDMIICTYVLSGVLEYKDNLGKNITIRPGEICVLNAGMGANYSLYNLSHHEPAHFMQIWFNPEQNGLNFSIEKKVIQSAAKWGQFCLLASHNGRLGSLKIFQDADLYVTYLEDSENIQFETFPERYYWLQALSGKFIAHNVTLAAGDGLMINDELEIKINCLEEGELLLIDQS